MAELLGNASQQRLKIPEDLPHLSGSHPWNVSRLDCLFVPRRARQFLASLPEIDSERNHNQG
jgi:hypothetical protein